MNEFKTVNCEQLMTTPLKPIEFCIDGMISTGLFILAGAPKVGKSWLALDMALSIAKGEKLLGRETKRGTALYLCLEDSYTRIQNRLFELTNEPSENLHFAIMAGTLGGVLEKQIENFKLQHPDLKIIIIDTLQKIRSGDESSYASDYKELSVLKNLADTLRIAILLVHHTRKCRDNDPFNMISGTTGISGCVDGSMVMIEKRIVAESEKYDEIVKQWLKQKPSYDLQIRQYEEKIIALKQQIEDLIMGKVTDKSRAEFYDSMIEKRENEITELQKKISDCREYDKVCRQRQQTLTSTSMLLDDILSDGRISDANLRMLVNGVTVHQNEDKSLDVSFEMNGDFTNSTMIILEPMFEEMI